MAAVVETLEASRQLRGSPVAVVAHTVKGKGVSFMENDYSWHSRVPTDEELQQALEELADPVAPSGAR
jgi:transketolase